MSRSHIQQYICVSSAYVQQYICMPSDLLSLFGELALYNDLDTIMNNSINLYLKSEFVEISFLTGCVLKQ